MNQSRLFTFGCSFTQYYWPTWADILGREFDQFENWGLCAAGNQYIFNSVIECNLKNNLQKTDTVIIMWTLVSRWDSYHSHHWQSATDDVLLNPSPNKQFGNYDIRGLHIRDIVVINAAMLLLDAIGCNYQFHIIYPLSTINLSKNVNNKIDDILNLYKSTVIKIKPSVYETLYNNDWNSLSGVTYRYILNAKLDQGIIRREEYQLLKGGDWPTYDNFLIDNLSGISDNIINDINSFNLFNRRDKQSTKIDETIAGLPDLHPLPNSHLTYIQKAMPEFNISAKTIAWANMHHNAIINNEVISFDRHQPVRL